MANHSMMQCVASSVTSTKLASSQITSVIQLISRRLFVVRWSPNRLAVVTNRGYHLTSSHWTRGFYFKKTHLSMCHLLDSILISLRISNSSLVNFLCANKSGLFSKVNLRACLSLHFLTLSWSPSNKISGISFPS